MFLLDNEAKSKNQGFEPLVPSNVRGELGWERDFVDKFCESILAQSWLWLASRKLNTHASQFYSRLASFRISCFRHDRWEVQSFGSLQAVNVEFQWTWLELLGLELMMRKNLSELRLMWRRSSWLVGSFTKHQTQMHRALIAPSMFIVSWLSWS